MAVIKIIEAESLLEASTRQGKRLLRGCRTVDRGSSPRRRHPGHRACSWRSNSSPTVSRKEPFDRGEAVTERLLAACLENGLIVYPASKGVDGIRGDAVLFGPPLTISDRKSTRSWTGSRMP